MQRAVIPRARSRAKCWSRPSAVTKNRAVEAAQVIEELIQLARHMREANARGEKLRLSNDELAFYDALETNDSAVQVFGDETLRDIARELIATVRGNVTIDWTLRENVRANLRRLVKRILRKARLFGPTSRKRRHGRCSNKPRCCRLAGQRDRVDEVHRKLEQLAREHHGPNECR